VNAKFEVSTTMCGEVIARSIFVAWELVSSLKTAKEVIFERVSTIGVNRWAICLSMREENQYGDIY
jgi:hypothetical protein